MNPKVEELVEWVNKWIQEELTCIGCESTGGEKLECDRDNNYMCPSLRQDIVKLLSHPDLFIPVHGRGKFTPLAEALREKTDESKA